ncbi:MAG: hypothetical protein QNJ53_27720 [Pleurocapsa sp. MO_192.B19]|nr:hypothetical protein [Pleurocapsa sp. MO_192.B19]
MLISNIGTTGNLVGISALISFFAAFYPAISNLFPRTINRKKDIFKLAKIGLIGTIFLGLVHGLMMTQKEDIDFNNLATYWTYATGLLTLNIFIFFAFTLSELKLNIKKLTYLTYAALFFLACHIWQQTIHLW